ncbi:MAG: superoxide dismutase [Cyanomargarita calcarea GSE-NOS-MK-12-04C]|uniref:superoxide dismutase n=1 Tax=Cyanomargarita calcarea GSE-NOS-MK-12-04C TaxID=2839659 RepID=A0A951QM22_9CYAN|nr:superoxide dismutase [Cyanomargarita calcarea GSE-NOS-MK-12-04C]
MIKFLRQKMAFFITGIALVGLLFACQDLQTSESQTQATPTTTPINTSIPVTTTQVPAAYPDRQLSASPAQLPQLPYAYDGLEKAIDAETMKLHHDRHHATYVENLNQALEKHPELRNRSVELMLRDLNAVPEDIRESVRNNGGGHLNHTIFWQIMSPNGGGQPTGVIAEQINQTFGSFDAFKKQFNEAGGDRFGSGWVWLVRSPQGQLQIVNTPNQDNPISDGSYPIMGNDVWEHAYYLRYQNRRADYLNNWWNVVNWSEINRRFQVTSQQQS